MFQLQIDPLPVPAQGIIQDFCFNESESETRNYFAKKLNIQQSQGEHHLYIKKRERN